MTIPAQPRAWSRKGQPERGYGHGLASWQGAAVLLAFLLILGVPPAAMALVGGSLRLVFAIALTCCIGGSLWMVRMIRTPGDPDA